MNALARLAPYAFGSIIGALLLFRFAPTPELPYTQLIVPARQITRLEPDTIVRWRDRIVYRTVPPETTAEAPGAAADVVAAFCRPDTVRVPSSATTDTLWLNPAMVLLRSGSLDQRRWFRPDALTLTGVENTGDLRQWRYTTRGDVDFSTIGSGVLVRSPRWGIAGDLLEAGVWFGLGYLVGR